MRLSLRKTLSAHILCKPFDHSLTEDYPLTGDARDNIQFLLVVPSPQPRSTSALGWTQALPIPTTSRPTSCGKIDKEI
jgi:hypothetical protein